MKLCSSLAFQVIMIKTVLSAPQMNSDDLMGSVDHNHVMLQSLFPNLTDAPVDFVLVGSIGKPSNFVESHHGNESNDDDTTNQPECQMDESDSKSYKIVGGQEVESSTKYPWVAKVWSKVGFCSASIISANKILTARHCVTSGGDLKFDNDSVHPASSVSVSVGTIDLIDNSKRFGVESIITPPSDSPGDFAILVLNESLPRCDPSIKPICMSEAPTEDLTPGTVVTTMGWGLINADRTGSQSKILKEATITVLADSECFGGPNLNYFCAKYDNGVICSGDSGGPVVTQMDGKYFQIGVNSYTRGNAGPIQCDTANTMGFASTTSDQFISLAKPFFTC